MVCAGFPHGTVDSCSVSARAANAVAGTEQTCAKSPILSAIFSLDGLALPPLAQLSVHPSPLAVAIIQVHPAYTSFCFPHQPVTGQGNMQRGNAK